jgi:hypothetical protein
MASPRRVLALLIGVVLASFAGSAWASGGDKPEIKSTSVGSVTATGAVLHASVKPRDLETTYVFEYGLTKAYGAQTPSGSAGNGNSEVSVSAEVSGLQPETTYHFRVVATNSKGTVRGPDKSFTTLVAPSDPGGGSDPGTDPGTDPGSDPGTTDPGTNPGLHTSSGVPKANLGKSVLVAPASGELRVRRPGSSTFVALLLGSELPVGSEIDARHGSLALTAALPSGATETGYFGAGRFKLTQDSRGYIDLYLRGKYCSRAGVASTAGVSATTARKKQGRRLWGRDHGGRFRTHGRNSHATVRGTRWLVADSCKGTYTRVSQGSVVVRDTVRKKRIVLKAGEHYLARPRH